MLFRAVLEKLIALFNSYVPRDNDVGKAKAEERKKIVDFLSKLTARCTPLSCVDISTCINFLSAEVGFLKDIRKKFKEQNSAEDELPAATLDGFTMASIKVLTNLFDYWAQSVLSIRHQKESLAKNSLPENASSILIKSLQNVEEQEPLGFLQVQLILFMIDVDIRFESDKASKSKVDRFYSGFSSVLNLTNYNHTAEDNLKPVVYKHLVKMKTLLPTSKGDDAKYMKFIDDALIEALGYEAQQSGGKLTHLKEYLNTVSIRIADFPSLKKYRENVVNMCDEVRRCSEAFAKELANQEKPEESKSASISEESTKTLEPEVTSRSSLSETYASVVARGSTSSSYSPSASPFQMIPHPTRNPSVLVLEAETTVHISNSKLR